MKYPMLTYTQEMVDDNIKDGTLCFFEDDLSKLNLSGQDLTDAFFDSCNLSGINFEGSNLTEAFFENCNLSGANFKNTNLKELFMMDCNLSEANFEGATIDDDYIFYSATETIGCTRPDGKKVGA